MTARALFITGTDTEIGKTYVACEILRAARAAGLKVAVFKPVAAGCEATAQGLRNDDALALQTAGQAAGQPAHAYDLINPYAFREPIAPHLAAAGAGVEIDLDHIAACYGKLAEEADLVIIEGAGGWAVPLGADFGFPELVERMQWPVLLVVGMRLGCLNHALLSAESITRRARLLGWVANCLPPEPLYLAQNIASLRQRLAAPCLGTLTSSDAPQPGLHFDALYSALS